jgi:hypothetical protein
VVEWVKTAALGWHQVGFHFTSDDDLGRLEQLLGEKLGERAASDLLRLRLDGVLGIEATTRLASVLQTLEARLLRLRVEDHTVVAPTGAETSALTNRAGDPLVSRVAAQLVARAAGDGEDAAAASLALRELHAALTKP